MNFLERVESLNEFEPEKFWPFYAGETLVGYIRNDNVDLALSCDKVLVKGQGNTICIHANHKDFQSRSDAIASILPYLEKNCAFAFPLKNEMFPVVTGFGNEPILQIERNATIFFGVKVFGLHVNGYTLKNDKIHMWLGRRGPTLRGWPNMLDQMVAGGQPIGMSLKDNLVKEAEEEASLPCEISSKAKPVTSISYSCYMLEGVRRDTLFVYDLELPEDVHPKEDGDEVAGYLCLPVEDVMEIIENEKGAEKFKPNCNLVAIDFFIRHGIISADNYKDYHEIIRKLRSA